MCSRGLLFDDCKLILQQLNRDAVPYFLVPHADFFGVHIQAPGGIVVEAICPTTSKGDMPESSRGQRDLVAARVQAARLYIAPWAQRNRRRRCRHGSWLDVDAAARAYRHKADIKRSRTALSEWIEQNVSERARHQGAQGVISSGKRHGTRSIDTVSSTPLGSTRRTSTTVE